MLSAAIVVFALTRPVPAPTPAAPVVSTAEIQHQIEAATNKVVAKAVAESEARFDQRISEIEKANLKDRRELVRWADSWIDYSKHSEMVYRHAGYGPPASATGGVQ
jgi:hypothetical protein